MNPAKSALSILILSSLCSCNATDLDRITSAVNSGFGTAISDNVVELCYRDNLYRVVIKDYFQDGILHYGKADTVIPMLEDPNSSSSKFKKCSNFTLKQKSYKD